MKKNRTEEVSFAETDYGKLPPQDISMERIVLGSILTDQTLMKDAYNILTEETFYRSSHQLIFKSIQYLYDCNEPITAQSVTFHLKRTGALDLAGGPFEIVQLTVADFSVYMKSHCLCLKELSLKRKMIAVCSRALCAFYEDTSDVFEQMHTIQGELDRIQGEIMKIQEVDFPDSVTERADQLKKMVTDKNFKTGIPTGIYSLDAETGGLQPGDLIIIAGRPAMGKTAFALHCARHQAKTNTPVGFFSLEMETAQLVDRLISQEGEINMRSIKRGEADMFSVKQIEEGAQKVRGYNLYVHDKSMTMNEICSKAKSWKMKYNIQALYIDYLQLIKMDQGRNKTRDQLVGETTQALKSLAKDLGIPLIVLCQLSREVDKREQKMPQLSDLRESGNIEQDADIVIFPYRPAYYNPGEESELCWLIIGKHRNGKPGKVKSKFLIEFQSFHDYDSMTLPSRQGRNFTEPAKDESTPF